MANCNRLFKDFNKVITPSEPQLNIMRESRLALEEKIVKKFQEKGLETPHFRTQGSSSKDAKTIIVKTDGTYDADRGVYLSKKPDVSAETIKSYIYDAVKNHTDGGASNKQKCIRVLFKCKYDIDFTACYEIDTEDYVHIAVNGKGWINDNPSGIINWINEHVDEDCQLLRIIKYIKSWASEQDKNFKMPSGIALTVWAVRNFKNKTDRDDEALSLTLEAIQTSIGNYVCCFCPKEPYDDLVSKRSDEQKKKFLDALKAFAIDSKKAINEPNQLQASIIWQKYLGKRFPFGEDADIDKREQALTASALIANKRLDHLGRINEHSGVNHLTHRNYGA